MRSGLAPGGAIPSTVWGWGAFAPGGVSGGARRALLPVGGLGGVIAIATGAEHAVALTARGAVWAWGNRIPGMGTHTSAYPEAPTRIPGLDEIVAIAAGDYHSLALRDDGTVWAWGFNGSGQLGDGTTTPRRLPRPVEGLPDPIAVAAGQAHNLVLQRDGTVWAWGQGAYGQLGNGNLVPQHRPIPVPGLESMAGIAAGGRHSLAVGHDGAVWAWGNGRYGALGTGTLDSPPRAVRLEYLPEVVSVAAGWNHSLALTRAGEVWAWGDNQQGQLGLGSSGGVIPVPQPVAGVSSVVAIAAGYQHSLALRDDGTVWAWGSNRDGALGTGRPEGISDATPSPVEGLHGITAIAARGTYSIALQGPQARRLPPPTFAPTTAGSARR